VSFQLPNKSLTPLDQNWTRSKETPDGNEAVTRVLEKVSEILEKHFELIGEGGPGNDFPNSVASDRFNKVGTN